MFGTVTGTEGVAVTPGSSVVTLVDVGNGSVVGSVVGSVGSDGDVGTSDVGSGNGACRVVAVADGAGTC